MAAAVRILHLEDDPECAEHIRRLLEDASIPHILESATDRSAFDAALASGSFDLILASSTVEGIEGTMPLEVAMAEAPDTPLIFVSPRTGEEAVIDAMTAGAADYVLKDNLERLVPAMRRVIRLTEHQLLQCREALALAREKGEAESRKPGIHAAEETKEQLRRRVEELETLMDLVPVAIWVSHDPLCSEIIGNRTANEFFEAKRDENVSASTSPGRERPRRFFHDGRELTPDELPMQYAAIHGVEVRNTELEVHLASGRRITMFGSASPLWDANGLVRGCLGAFLDITDRKRTEDDLLIAHDQLEQKVRKRTEELAKTISALQKEILERKKAKDALKAEMQSRMQAVEELRENERLLIQQSRQAAMGEMIGNIAHQWRQPLNTLGLLIQGLPLSLEFGDFDKRFLADTAERSMQLIQHMSQTIDDFRNFFKPNKEKISFNLTDNIRKTISLVEGSFKTQGIEISEVFADDVNVNGYPNELSQVFLNILNNARDVFLERNTQNPLLAVNLERKRNRATVTITDNAGGIPASIIDSLFDPYFTTKGPLGTGVGLFMSKVIVERSMNGRLSARNTSTGAQFLLEFRCS